MKNYLDPIYLAVSEDAWVSRVYSKIFDSLKENIDIVEELEKTSNTLYKLVKFKFNQDLFIILYDHHPFKNEPKVQAFYQNLFNKVWSDISRRFDLCPNNCNISNSKYQILCCENSNMPAEVILAWTRLINQCVLCSLQEPLLCLSPTGYQTNILINDVDDNDISFSQASSVFSQTSSVYKLISVDAFLLKETISESSLRIAIKVFYYQSTEADRMQSNLQPQVYCFHENFWRTIERARLVEEDVRYRQKFIDSLTQIVYAVDIDIRLHKYGKISIDNKKYDKYSADVFKMGRGTTDRRCSRIFFCKITNKICFYEFDPNFHEGE